MTKKLKEPEEVIDEIISLSHNVLSKHELGQLRKLLGKLLVHANETVTRHLARSIPTSPNKYFDCKNIILQDVCKVVQHVDGYIADYERWVNPSYSEEKREVPVVDRSKPPDPDLLLY